jgi:ubiquinone/menaquinone biosynthesis C-methylase UbiE
MEAYTGFAQVYDMFMDNIDYDSWCDYLISLLKEYNVNDGIVLDMGCGTGNVTKRLSEARYDMIGIDNSVDMLNVAMQKRGEDESILYLLQDMREFELYGTVSAIVSICDSINYITDDADLVQVFLLVENYLDPEGVFIFDLKTKSYYERLGMSVIAEDREDCSFIWDNYFDGSDNINEYQLSIFVKGDDGRYDKFTEEHYQRAYTLCEIRQALEKAGLKFVTAYNAFTRDSAEEKNDRIYVVAKKSKE